MDSFINRENLRNDILGYAPCMYRPTLMSKEKVLTVIDNIPEGIVRCRDCNKFDVCEFGLGADGFCSCGEHRE